MNLQGLTINFLGDSITEGVSVEDIANNRYDNILKTRCGLKEVRNYGVGGTRIAHQFRPSAEARWDLNFCGRAEKMNPEADVVVVFGGTNDYGHGDAPLGSFEDRTPDTFYGACHYLFSGLVRKYLGKPIVIMTPLHRINELEIPDIKMPGDFGDLKTYTNIIREVAEFYSLPVLDLFATSGLQPGIKEIQETYIPDGLHPNDKGNEVIAHKLRLFLESIKNLNRLTT